MSDLTCCTCGKAMVRQPKSLPQGEATCQSCRRASHQRSCRSCGVAFSTLGAGNHTRGLYCSAICTGKARRIRAADADDVIRSQREASAPGLSHTARRHLLRRWKAQGRTCTYCDGRAESVDHVVPLVRGGTNYEGNLVPACLRCNSSKNGRFLVEWRTGLRVKPMGAPVVHAERRPKARPKPKARPVVQCAICDGDTTRRTYCSPECSSEGNRRRAREQMRARYRLSVGIPLDAPLYARAA